MAKLESIRKELSEAIKNCGISQSELARMLNLTQSTIAHYIKGDILPSLETFANLCALLELDANEILCLN